MPWPCFIIFLLGVATEGICLLEISFFFVIFIDFINIFYFLIPPLITGSRFSLNWRLGGFSLSVAMFDSSVVRDQNGRVLVGEYIDKIAVSKNPIFFGGLDLFWILKLFFFFFC